MEEFEEIFIKGIASSPGIALGRAKVIRTQPVIVPDGKISEDKIEEEIKRFHDAIEETVLEIESSVEKINHKYSNVKSIIDTTIMLLRDEYLIKGIEDRIRQGFSVESSIVQEFDLHKQLLQKSKNIFLRERSVEYDFTRDHLLANLKSQCNYYAIPSNSIIVANSVSPNDVIYYKNSNVGGIITEIGGLTSHSSVIARDFNIPEVIGVTDATKLIKDGDLCLIDGYTGEIRINPSDRSIEWYHNKKAEENGYRKQLGELIDLPSKTIDGREIKLFVNVNTLSDVEKAILLGFDGIGLVRTEYFVYSSGRVLSFDEQVNIYKEIAERAYPKIVTFRAFDFGSDKFSEGITHHEANPALGFRGIRFLLHRLDIFKTQIKAILIASKFKNVRLMLPMISFVKEVLKSKEIIESVKEELLSEDISFDENIPVGVMIETPASVLIANELAKNVDFFSIGTNDLIQYTIATDRTNQYTTELFDAFHPAVLRLIKMAIDAGKNHNIPVGICGEFASHSGATKLLIGMGIDELSVPPLNLPALKKRVLEVDFKEAEIFSEEVLKTDTAENVKKILNIY